MNITFLLGNGFDLNLGMKTRYTDFYNYFDERVNRENNLIYNWKIDSKEIWSDLELAYGQNLCRIDLSKEDLLDDSLEELEKLLIEYLKQEDIKLEEFVQTENVANEFTRSIQSFTSGLSYKDKETIDSFLYSQGNQSRYFNVLSFNYTKTIDSIFENAATNSPIPHRFFNHSNISDFYGKMLYVHGSVDNRIILSVDNETQINNKELASDAEFVETHTKKGMINARGESFYTKADELISKSNILCLYGLSRGVTDQRWWQKIVDWLTKADNRFLIIYDYRDTANEYISESKLIKNNRNLKKHFYYTAAGCNDNTAFDKIKNRILISNDYSIFNFSEIE